MTFLVAFYFCNALLLAVYGFVTLFYALWSQRRLGEAENAGIPDESYESTAFGTRPADQYPRVTVQLPVFNEQHVVARLLDAVCALEWPPTRLQVQVLDDSTDETTVIIADVLEEYQQSEAFPGVEIAHLRRRERSGFKAGALQAGMDQARGEFIAIFDADFVPPPDFLQRTISCFADESVGCVQSRWGHLNRDASLLTDAQALGIDGHFVVEQETRHRLGAFLNFNGTAGVWRRRCMEEVGGWQGDTLTEDLDLSYRAQLAGWRIHYQGDVIVPAELPVQVEAFKRQQFRWAKGSMQTAKKLLGELWRSANPMWLKGLGTLHLTNYAVHPLMLLNLILLLPIASSNHLLLHLAPFLTLAAMGPPMMYWRAMEMANVQGEPFGRERRSVVQRVSRLALLMAIGTGLSLNNTRAVIEALAGLRSDFRRTPKFAVTATSPAWETSRYALAHNWMTWLELGAAVYALALLVYCGLTGIWWAVAWLLLYSGGYGYIGVLTIAQTLQLRRARATSLAAESARVDELQSLDERHYEAAS